MMIYLTDRSRISAREDCERKRYLNYDFDVDGNMMGLQRRETSLALLDGTELHEAHARLLAFHAGLPEGVSLDETVNAMRGSFHKVIEERGVHGDWDYSILIEEQLALLEGLLRTFELKWIPRLLEEFDIVTIEKPMDWELAPGLVQKLRFDVVMRRKSDSQLVILDYKTMKYGSDAWAQKLERSRQTSLYILAAQEMFGESVEIAYLGLIKGSNRKDTAFSSPFFGQRIQSSAFCYAYKLSGGDGDVYTSKYTSKKGFKKVRTYEQMPMSEWVKWLENNESDELDKIFIFAPPFNPTPRQMARVRDLVVREELEYVQNIRRYQEMREKGITTGSDDLLDKADAFLDLIAAPMREDSCFKYGDEHRCEFYDICFNEGAIDNVLGDGQFIEREAHHSRELEVAA
jgi:hypothetical protein